MENKRQVQKFVFLTLGVISLCVFFFVLTMLRAQVSSSLAKYQAQIKLQTIPMPDTVYEIASYSAESINNVTCYLGEAYLLAGTDFEINDIQGFYEEYFSKQNWNVRVTPDSPTYSFFSATSKQTAYAGRAVEGITIRRCDKECLSNYEFPEEAIEETTKYKNILVLHTWFIPYEIRRNLCWCCSGG